MNLEAVVMSQHCKFNRMRTYHAFSFHKVSSTFSLTQAGGGRSQVLCHYVKLASISVNRDRNSGGRLERESVNTQKPSESQGHSSQIVCVWAHLSYMSNNRAQHTVTPLNAMRFYTVLSKMNTISGYIIVLVSDGHGSKHRTFYQGHISLLCRVE